jgi:hypothetical protein
MLSKERSELFKIEDSLSSGEDRGSKCEPDERKSQCPMNEICSLKKSSSASSPVVSHQCVCPREKNFRRVDGECREYLPGSDSCMLYLNECNPQLNEECVVVNKFSKHGTCQCKVGYKRNQKSFECELILLAENDRVSLEGIMIMSGDEIEINSGLNFIVTPKKGTIFV